MTEKKEVGGVNIPGAKGVDGKPVTGTLVISGPPGRRVGSAWADRVIVTPLVDREVTEFDGYTFTGPKDESK